MSDSYSESDSELGDDLCSFSSADDDESITPRIREKFNISNIGDLLELLEMTQHIEKFEQEAIDLRAVLYLKNEHLQSLGLDNDERNRLLRVVNLVKFHRSKKHGLQRMGSSALKTSSKFIAQKKSSDTNDKGDKQADQPKSVRFSLA